MEKKKRANFYQTDLNINDKKYLFLVFFWLYTHKRLIFISKERPSATKDF